ncbi:MAG: hypothetical protein R6X32_11225 [Chloroflexota bacterium]
MINGGMMKAQWISFACFLGLGGGVFLWSGLAIATSSGAVQAVAAPHPNSQLHILYDSSLGNLPNAQGFFYLTNPFTPQATQIYSDGVTILNTLPEQQEQAGYFARPQAVPLLQRSHGFTVTFTIQLDEEDHDPDNRAGFSVIVLSDDLRGIELGFWEDQIWAQEGGQPPDLFTRAEGAAFDTTAALTAYHLTIFSDTYTLVANQTFILSGPVRDYTAFEGQPDPYETPNLVFLGDNTSSARAQVRLAYMAITIPVTDPDPEPPDYHLYLPLMRQP